MTKQDILDYFNDINQVYNDSSRLDSLSNMIDEMLETAREKEKAIEKIDRIFNELDLCNAFSRPSFYTKDRSKYVVIDDKYHKGYQQALADAERRIKEIFEETDNE